MIKTLFTSEHVSPGHPDKVMDSIAEAVVDFHLNNSRVSRIAVDGLIKNNKVFLAGEITSEASANYFDIAQKVISEIGYTPRISPDFNHENFYLETIFTEQSPDIAQGVDRKGEEFEGAGDIGIMFGGAVNEAPDYTCWSHYLARLISYTVFNSGIEWLRPDQKTQVSIEYQDGVPVRIAEVVICTSHAVGQNHEHMKSEILDLVYNTLCAKAKLECWNIDVATFKLQFNPTGKFEVFGPVADSGLVGRKIVCDQYGGFFPVGGGNLNGKDATKVDRSAVYMARYVAKQMVAEKIADVCQIQVAYSIGQVEPVSINVETFGTSNLTQEELLEYVNQWSFKPGDIIRFFKLSANVRERKFDYLKLGMYGHIGARFGEEVEVPWEFLRS